MILIIILLILIGLTSYATFRCYHYYNDPIIVFWLLFALAVELIILLKQIAIELQL